MGQLVRNVAQGRFGPGVVHRVEIDAQDLSSGSYFVRLVSDEFVSESQTILLMK